MTSNTNGMQSNKKIPDGDGLSDGLVDGLGDGLGLGDSAQKGQYLGIRNALERSAKSSILLHFKQMQQNYAPK